MNAETKLEKIQPDFGFLNVNNNNNNNNNNNSDNNNNKSSNNNNNSDNNNNNNNNKFPWNLHVPVVFYLLTR